MTATKLICLDCDSTLSAIEGIDELARLRGPDVLARVEQMTNDAMNGLVPVEQVFGRRLQIIQPSRSDVAAVGRRYVETVEPTAQATLAALRARGWTVVIVSGGFTPAIRPLADFLRVERIEAVDLRFAADGSYAGFDAAFPTTRSGGKPEVVARLRRELNPSTTVMVGDGVSDLEAKPVVDRFVGFGRYVARPRVQAEASVFIRALDELIAIFSFSVCLATAGAVEIPPLLLVPFGLLLLMIAVMPLTPTRLHHWWEHNYPYVSLGLAVLVAGYYLIKVPAGGVNLTHTLHEYVSFIALIGSLYVVAGGVHLRVKGRASPWENVVFLAVGAVLANVIGTTGASMVMIRPWIRMNKIRVSAYHIVFFIFIVSNVGGALTPIGDPPLFLGYLRGVPFFWLIEHMWQEWLVTVGLVLAAFFVVDHWGFRRMPKEIQGAVAHQHDTFRLEGLPNLALLAVVVVGVFLPERYLIREIVMLTAAAVSLKITPKAIHEQNHFNFGPVKEVAFLFIGIFTTMMPALNYLEGHGSQLGFTRPAQYYYATGGLSAVLDNAPTYVNFLKLAETTFVAETADEQAVGGGDYDRRAVDQLLRTHSPIVVAISLGAVFFGAMTYIGNGPNFMVRSIAQSSGVHCPSFFGYIFRYSLPILLPILVLVGWIFL